MGENIVLSDIPLDELEPNVHQMVRRMGLDVQSIKRVSDFGLLVRAWKVSIDENAPFAILIETSGKVASSQLYPLVQAKVKGKIAIGDEFTSDARELADMKGLYLVDGAMFTKMIVEMKLVHLFKDYMSVPVADPTDAKRSLDWAMEIYARGELEKAHEMFTQILEKDKENVNARYFRARCSIDRERFDEAKADLGHILSLDDGNQDALTLLAHIYHVIGDPESEIDTYHVILKKYPKDLDTWLNLGVVFADAGDIDHAISSFRNAITINASDARAWNDLGIILRRSGDLKGARDAFSRLVNITPEDEGAWASLIAASIALDDLQQAKMDADKFERIGAKTMEGHLSLAWAYHSAGDGKRANEHLFSAKTLSPNAEKIWRELVPDAQIEPPKVSEPLPQPRIIVPEPEHEPVRPEKAPEPMQRPQVKEPEPVPEPPRPEPKQTVEAPPPIKIEEPKPPEPMITKEIERPIPKVEAPVAPPPVVETRPVPEPQPQPKAEAKVQPKVEPEPSPPTEVVKKEEIDSLLKDVTGRAPETARPAATKGIAEPREEEPHIEVSPDIENVESTLETATSGREDVPEASVDDILSLLEEKPSRPMPRQKAEVRPRPTAEERRAMPPRALSSRKSVKPEQAGVDDIMSLLNEVAPPGSAWTIPSEPVTPKDMPRPPKRTGAAKPVTPGPAGSGVDEIMALLGEPLAVPPPPLPADRATRSAPPPRQERSVKKRDDLDELLDRGVVEDRARTKAEPPAGSSRERLAAVRMLMALGEHDEVHDLLEGEKASEAGLLKASTLISAGKGREAYMLLRDMGPSTEVVRGKISALILTGDWGNVLGELKSLPEGTEKGLIRVVCLSHMRKYDDALQLLDSLDLNVPLFRALKGLVLHKAGRIDDALDEYNEAVNEEPTLLFAWHNMGAIYSQRGQREEAQTCHENAEEIWKEYRPV